MGSVRRLPWIGVLLLLTVAGAPAGDVAYTAEECPVVGNLFSGIYHVPGQANYREMLQRNQRGRDNRVCFPSEWAARVNGYRRSRSPDWDSGGGEGR